MPMSSTPPTARSARLAFVAVLAMLAGLLAIGATAQATTAQATPAGKSAHTLPALPRVALHHGSATAARPAITAQRGQHTSPTAPAACCNMTFHGGPVQNSPKVYLLFWGSQWSSDPNGVESYNYYYFNSLGTAPDYWSPIVNQYGSYPPNPVFGGWVQDTSAAPYSATQSQLAAEAAAGADYFGVAGNINAQVVVLSPTGTHPDNFPSAGFCAWHSYTYDSAGRFVAFTNMPYVLDAGSGCGQNSVQGALDGFSIVGGHEFAEAATDPALNAWYYNSGSGEIGDLCAWNLFLESGLPYGNFAQQRLWSNNNTGCVA